VSLCHTDKGFVYLNDEVSTGMWLMWGRNQR